MPGKPFLSYSSQDRLVAESLVRALGGCGVQVWFAPPEVAGGDFFARPIPEAIRDAEAVLLLASRHSVGHRRSGLRGSQEVERELILANDRRVIPLAIDDALVDGADDSFAYLLANRQYIDLRAAVRNGEYDEMAQAVAAAIHHSEYTRPPTDVLGEAETHLKAGLWQAAIEAIPIAGLTRDDRDRAALLKIIAQLQSKPIRDLSKLEADAFVVRLNTLRTTAHLPAVLYVLGAISHYFYEARAIHDATGGIARLKASAKDHGRLPAKYFNMIRPMLPKGSTFEVNWERR